MWVFFLYVLPLVSILHLFFISKSKVRIAALTYSLFTFLYASFLWYIAEFDSNALAFITDVRLEFIFPLHYVAAIDSISFCFILLSLLLYPCVYFGFMGSYYRKSS